MEPVEIGNQYVDAPILVRGVVEHQVVVAVHRGLLDLAVGRKRNRTTIHRSGPGSELVLIEIVETKIHAQAGLSRMPLSPPLRIEAAATTGAGQSDRRPRQGDQQKARTDLSAKHCHNAEVSSPEDIT